EFPPVDNCFLAAHLETMGNRRQAAAIRRLLLCEPSLEPGMRPDPPPKVLRSTIWGAPRSSLIMFFHRSPLANLDHVFASSRFRKAASPASDTLTHFGSGEASAS